MDLCAEVEAALSGTGQIAKGDLLRWIHDGDLATKARVYKLTQSAWPRIAPTPSMEEQCGFMAEYLLQCVEEDPPPDDCLHSGFEAARTLAGWLKHLVAMEHTEPVIERTATLLARLYERGEENTRNRVETGALEHVLEDPRLRSYFARWRDSAVLQKAYSRALEWGEAHAHWRPS